MKRSEVHRVADFLSKAGLMLRPTKNDKDGTVGVLVLCAGLKPEEFSYQFREPIEATRIHDYYRRSEFRKYFNRAIEEEWDRADDPESNRIGFVDPKSNILHYFKLSEVMEASSHGFVKIDVTSILDIAGRCATKEFVKYAKNDTKAEFDKLYGAQWPEQRKRKDYIMPCRTYEPNGWDDPEGSIIRQGSFESPIVLTEAFDQSRDVELLTRCLCNAMGAIEEVGDDDHALKSVFQAYLSDETKQWWEDHKRFDELRLKQEVKAEEERKRLEKIQLIEATIRDALGSVSEEDKTAILERIETWSPTSAKYEEVPLNVGDEVTMKISGGRYIIHSVQGSPEKDDVRYMVRSEDGAKNGIPPSGPYPSSYFKEPIRLRKVVS